jgi:hypothetical protein
MALTISPACRVEFVFSIQALNISPQKNTQSPRVALNTVKFNDVAKTMAEMLATKYEKTVLLFSS